MSMSTEIYSHICLPEPKLAFHPDRPSDCDIHPLRGLLRFGPHSSGLLPDPIRVATISPIGESDQLYAFLRLLKTDHRPKERKGYLPNWPGFHSVFGLHVRPASNHCHIGIESELEDVSNGSSRPHITLADRLVRAIHRLEAHRTEFDIIVIYLPQRWSIGFVGSANEDFDLHDHLKATTATLGTPIQLLQEDGAISYHCQASVMWHIGLALYVKAGGIPWKLAGTDPETAYIGISYAIRPKTSNLPQFVTCCSQVFDAHGSGLEFVAYNAHEVEVQRDNPFLSRTEMFRVMTRSLDLYRRRHAGRSPRRVMVHKTTEFKSEEIEGAMEAFHLCEAVDLVQVVENVGWRGARIGWPRKGKSKGTPTAFPVSRGTTVDIGPRNVLLWTHGDVQGIDSQRSFFKGGNGTPQPLRLVRHAGHGPWDDTVNAILGLSKMNWNNDSLYDQLPVTIGYAKVLSRVIKRMPNLRHSPYQMRFFM